MGEDDQQLTALEYLDSEGQIKKGYHSHSIFCCLEGLQDSTWS